MQPSTQAVRAYEAASVHRSPREQEADIFRRAIGALKAARDAGPVQRVRALADNRRLWMAVGDLMRDPANALPIALRASIISVGMAIEREMDREQPDFAFLIDVNENIAAGLSGQVSAGQVSAGQGASGPGVSGPGVSGQGSAGQGTAARASPGQVLAGHG